MAFSLADLRALTGDNEVTDNNIGPQPKGGSDNTTEEYNPLINGGLSQDEIRDLLDLEAKPTGQNNQQTTNESDKGENSQQPKEGEEMAKKVVKQNEYNSLIESYMQICKTDFFAAANAVSEQYIVGDDTAETAPEETGKSGVVKEEVSTAANETIEDVISVLEHQETPIKEQGNGDVLLEDDINMSYDEFKSTFAIAISTVVSQDTIDGAKAVAAVCCSRQLACRCMVNLLSRLTQNDWDNATDLLHPNEYSSPIASTAAGARALLLGSDFVMALDDVYNIYDWPDETHADLEYAPPYCALAESTETVFRELVAERPDATFEEVQSAFLKETVFLEEPDFSGFTLKGVYDELHAPAEEEEVEQNLEGLEDLFSDWPLREEAEESAQEDGEGSRERPEGDGAEVPEDEAEHEIVVPEYEDEDHNPVWKYFKIAIFVIVILIILGFIGITALSNKSKKQTEETGATGTDQTTLGPELIVQQPVADEVAQAPVESNQTEAVVSETTETAETAATETAEADPEGSEESEVAEAEVETESTAETETTKEGFYPDFVPAKPGSVFDLPAECYGPITGSNGTYLCEVTITQEQAQAMYDDIVSHGWTEDAMRFFAFPDGMMAKHSVTLEELTPIINGEATSFTTPLVENLSTDGKSHTYTDDVDWYYVSKVLTKDKAMELIQQCEQEGLNEINIDPSHPVEVVPGLVVKNFILTTDYMQDQINLMNAVGADRCCIQFRASK